jgi:Polyketide cyclase / dehydrase and lipid transport
MAPGPAVRLQSGRRLAPVGRSGVVYRHQVIVGEASATVGVGPSDVFEFVLDLDRYRLADHKIGRVGAIERSGDRGTVTFSGRIRGLPGPSGTYPFVLTPSRLVFGSAVSGPARWFLDFEGTFECAVTDHGTVVTHRESFDFKSPWRWMLEPLLRRWLESDIAQEMVRFEKLVGS